jgi:hypothetical protein
MEIKEQEIQKEMENRVINNNSDSLIQEKDFALFKCLDGTSRCFQVTKNGYFTFIFYLFVFICKCYFILFILFYFIYLFYFVELHNFHAKK